MTPEDGVKSNQTACSQPKNQEGRETSNAGMMVAHERSITEVVEVMATGIQLQAKGHEEDRLDVTNGTDASGQDVEIRHGSAKAKTETPILMSRRARKRWKY